MIVIVFICPLYPLFVCPFSSNISSNNPIYFNNILRGNPVFELNKLTTFSGIYRSCVTAAIQLVGATQNMLHLCIYIFFKCKYTF